MVFSSYSALAFPSASGLLTYTTLDIHNQLDTDGFPKGDELSLPSASFGYIVVAPDFWRVL